MKKSMIRKDIEADIAANLCERGLGDVTFQNIRGPSRKARFVEARRVSAKVLRHEYKMSLCGIGRFIARDHTTVIHLLGMKSGKQNTRSHYDRMRERENEKAS